MIDGIKAIQDRIEELTREIKNPLPTPPVGSTVVWYNRADKNTAPYAAIVTGIDEPGRIKITMFPPNGFFKTAQGVHYIEHPMHSQKNNHVSEQSGAWAYPAGVSIPKDHFDAYRSRREAMKAALEDDLKKALEVKEKEKVKA